MATASIEAAKRYYLAFKTLQNKIPDETKLKIGIVFSYAQNEDEPDGLLPEEEFEADKLDASSRDFLEAAIEDYNQIFATNCWDFLTRVEEGCPSEVIFHIGDLKGSYTPSHEFKK
jgi:type I site-specific restriction-modification system R (restriction) subunit